MGGLVVVMLVALALVAVSVALAVWWVKRVIQRLRRFGGRVVDRGALSVRARVAPGAARQVAGARLALSTGIDQTRRVLEDAARRDFVLGDVPGLFRRIEHLAGSVDAELRLLEGDRYPAQQERLPAVLRRCDELTSMAGAIRATVSGLHAEMQADGFGGLHRDLDLELQALRAGAAALRRSS